MEDFMGGYAYTYNILELRHIIDERIGKIENIAINRSRTKHPRLS